MVVETWITFLVVLTLLVLLIKNLAPPDLAFVGATALLAALGIITAEEAFAGFSNSGVLAVAALFVVAAALRETGALDFLGTHVLGKARSGRGALARLAPVVLPMSAFLNNTPVVAMFIPVVLDWCRRHNVAPSKLLIPLSYLTILGGTCTLIGTATNLVINGLMIENNLPGMSLFEVAWVGVPSANLGVVYLLTIVLKLLP